MHYDFAVVVPAGTTEASPYERTLKLTAGLIVFPSIEFPAGCRGYVSIKLMHGGHKLYPLDPSGVYNTDDFTVPISDFYPLFAAPYELKAVAWSPECTYDHTITVRINLIRLEELTKLIPLFAGLEKLLEFAGVPVGEEIPPAPPAPPIPEIAPPPEEEVPTPPPEEEVPAPPPEEAAPPGPQGARGTVEEAQWEIDRKALLPARILEMIADYVGSISEARRDRIEEWSGFRHVPEEMDAEELAAWKDSYPLIDPYFTYASFYPETAMTPGQYYDSRGIYELA